MVAFTTDASNDKFLIIGVPDGAKAMLIDSSWTVNTAGLDSLNVYSTNDPTLGLAQGSDIAVAGWDAEPLIESKLQCADGADGADQMEIAARKKYYLFYFQHVSGTSATYDFTSYPVYAEGEEPATLQTEAAQTLDSDPGSVVFVLDLLGDTNPGVFLRWDGDVDCDDGVTIEVTPFEDADATAADDWWPVDAQLDGPAGAVSGNYDHSWVPLPNIAGHQLRVTVPYDSGTTSDVECWLARMEPRYQ